MALSVRARVLAWLVAVILPAVGVGWFALDLIGDRLSERVQTDLANVRRLEAARIGQALIAYEEDAASLAAGPHVVDFVSGVTAARQGTGPGPAVIGGYDGFAPVDPEADRPLEELVQALQAKARTTGSEVVDVRIIGADGSNYGQTGGFGWEPYRPEVVDEALDEGRVRFGNAFRPAMGDDRLAVVAPVIDGDGTVVGALVLEARLGPIVDLVVEHEGFGRTSEAHIAQPDPEGNAEFITLLRFERDAAFTKVVPRSKGLPINQSLEAPGGVVVRSPDYRAVDSVLAIETIDSTGWGLVVKIDAAEAFAPVDEVRRALAVAGVLTVVVLLVCTAALLNPLGRRLRRLSEAARRVAAGDYRSAVGDAHRDEIGDLGRSIDQLAADLENDIRMRTMVEQRLRHQVSHDDLTGIHNRRFATQWIEGLATGWEPWTLLVLDLDGFKSINDTHGHAVGDEVLRAVADRLSAAAPGGAVVARWGGDEFVVVLQDTGRDKAERQVEAVRELFEIPVPTSVGEVRVWCSVGLAVANEPDVSLDRLFSAADADMFAQKPTGFEGRRTWTATERHVAAAIDEDRIEVWLQPIMTADLDGQRLVGAEALVRLRTTDGELVPPAEFLPMVAATDLGRRLDLHVADRAVATTAEWRDLGLLGPDFALSTNFGAGALADPDLAAQLQAVLEGHGLAPERFVVELAETAAGLDPGLLGGLRRLGVGTAIDDAGIRNSNFDRMLTVGPQMVKIDRRWLLGDEREQVVLEHLVATCRSLGLQTVAEGIETRDQFRLVCGLEVDLVQGFLFGRPVPFDGFREHWLPGPAVASAPAALVE